MTNAGNNATPDQDQTADAEHIQQSRSRAASHFTFED